MKKALLTLSALALCVAAGSALAKEYKELRFGVDPSYAPFESKAADGSLVGFDIDLGNAICAELKVKCKWVESDFDGMIPGLKANKFDGVISSMTVTPAREKVIDFSSELFSGPTATCSRKVPASRQTSRRSKAKPSATSKAPSRKPTPRPFWTRPA
jgi:histidine transport system substrate-binding protein